LKRPASLLSGEGATGRRHQLRDQDAAHRAPSSTRPLRRSTPSKDIGAGYGSRQHLITVGLSLRYRPFEQCELHRRRLCEAHQCVGSVFNYRNQQQSQDLGRGRIQAGYRPLLWARRWSGKRPRHRPTKGIVSGAVDAVLPRPFRFRRTCRPAQSGHGRPRTLSTNYNVLDNRNGAHEVWLRSGVQWDIATMCSSEARSIPMRRTATGFNNEINAFNDSPTPSAGAQGESIASGCRSITARSSMANIQRSHGQFEPRRHGQPLRGHRRASSLQFNAVQDDVSPTIPSALVDPIAALWLQQTKTLHPCRQCRAGVETVSRLTPTWR